MVEKEVITLDYYLSINSKRMAVNQVRTVTYTYKY